jgi:uncharacterized membrane protein YdjX (TVP38/TMEM64 family)
MKRRLISSFPLIIILAAMLYVYLSGIYRDFNFATIQLKHAEWKQYIHLHPFLSAFYYILIYIFSVCLIIPDSIFLSLLGGFLFPLPLAITYIVFSETAGATLFFLAADAALKHDSHYLSSLQKKVQRRQIYYLLFFRFSHLLPYWVINVASALFNIRKWTFIWTSCLGVFPLAIVLAQGGSGLSRYFEQHTHFSITDVFTTQIKIMLICLGLLTLLPLIYEQLKTRLR